MHGPGEVLGSFEFTFHESFVDRDLCRDVREFAPLPRLDLLSHGFEIPLHSINANRNAIDEGKRLRVFSEDRCEHAADGQDDG